MITKFGPPQNLVTDRGTEYLNQDKVHLCAHFSAFPLHVLHILLGQMVQLKSKTVIMELSSVYFYKILLLVDHFQLKGMLTITTLLRFLKLSSPHIKLFSMHTLLSQ